MKKIVLFIALACAASTFAQSQAQPQSQSQLLCRDLKESGGFLYQGETVINGQACRQVAYAPVQQQVVSMASTAPSAAPAPVPVASAPVAAAPIANPTTAASVASVPNEAGMYLVRGGDSTKVLGQIVEFERSGSLLASKVTLGVKSRKANAQLLGAHATTVTNASPEFYFVPAKQESDAGVNAGDLILIRLEEKGNRRQFEVGAEGDWRASKGISITHQIQLDRSEVKPGVFKITPVGELGRGEYGLYLARGEGLAAYIYDFSVQ